MTLPEGGVVRYERFLFTRNQRRDFTAFERPASMTNKEVSVIANAFNFVNDISPLTAARPALYCFPLGGYLYVLRHYDSGRTHAGRAIPVIEGIAIRREDENALGVLLAEIISQQATLLNVSEAMGDVETLERQTSDTFEWSPPLAGDHSDEVGDAPDFPADNGDNNESDVSDESDDTTEHDLADALAQRYPTDWLLFPFNDEGRALLLTALSDERLPILHFAFGSHPDLVAKLKESGITFDVVGYGGVEEPEFRPRESRKAIDVREILPDEASVPSNWPASPLVQPEPADLADGRTAPVQSGEPIPPIYEERVRRRRRQRGLLRRLLDALLGR